MSELNQTLGAGEESLDGFLGVAEGLGVAVPARGFARSAAAAAIGFFRGFAAPDVVARIVAAPAAPSPVVIDLGISASDREVFPAGSLSFRL